MTRLPVPAAPSPSSSPPWPPTRSPGRAPRAQGAESILMPARWAPGAAEEDEVDQLCEDLQVLLDLTPKKRCSFHCRVLECKSRKSKDIKFGTGVQNEAGQRLTGFHQENMLVTANTLFQQHKRRLDTWTSPDGQYWNQTDYVLCSQRWRSYILSAKTKSGADYGSDHEHLIAKFRLKLKKIGKTTRSLRYDQNQIPYDYTVEVMNTFKGLEVADRVPENYRWKLLTLYRR